MSKTSHPYFIENDPDRRTTATLLVGTADEFGIDQHDIQMTQGGFNVTRALAEALGYDVDSDEEEEEEEQEQEEQEEEEEEQEQEEQEEQEDQAETSADPTAPIVTGTPGGGDLTQAVPASVVEDEPQTQPVDYASWEYNDLKSAVATRGIETEDKRTETLISALVAADAAEQ